MDEKHLEVISKIMNMSEGDFFVRGKRTIKVKDWYICILKDKHGNCLDGIQYTTTAPDDIFWTFGKPINFYEKYLSEDKDLKFELYSMRCYGEPKLKKPIELKGEMVSFSVDYIPKKCRCQVFVKGDDVWIKHTDYFSSSMSVPIEEAGAPLGYLVEKYLNKKKANKFIYGDAWGDIVLRNEAWIKLNNLVFWINNKKHKLEILDTILRQQEQTHKFNKYHLDCTDMESFFENVINSTSEHIKVDVR